MKRILIRDELKIDEYKKIIKFAFTKSDAFMLVTYRYSTEIEKTYRTPNRSEYDTEEEYLIFKKYFEQMKKESYVKKDIFEKNTEPFGEKLKPYLIKKRNYPTEWPSSRVVFYDKCTSVDICIYRICGEVKKYLLEPKGIFNWKYPYFPDDLCFFKDGYCWFSTVAHEEYACIYLESDDDIEKLKEIGMEFEISEWDKKDIDLFYEEYTL